ncbi:hypothetical protein CDCA_CDCA03G1108 [Cyanidium caldarium]|uniref:Uncharacterized protein n=1 Tax=Cyanidium caldarium TaxID=2771 RepID=A0AAV9IT92_CYACA|nr:hypothetical protein CDCA_CDCA03G1108 [Cyanidium caldarium]
MTFATVTFVFAVGICTGMYVAQEYRVPNVKWWMEETRRALLRYEHDLRKEASPSGRDNWPRSGPLRTP